jgi:hypothetical protein
MPYLILKKIVCFYGHFFAKFQQNIQHFIKFILIYFGKIFNENLAFFPFENFGLFENAYDQIWPF